MTVGCCKKNATAVVQNDLVIDFLALPAIAFLIIFSFLFNVDQMSSLEVQLKNASMNGNLAEVGRLLNQGTVVNSTNGVSLITIT